MSEDEILLKITIDSVIEELQGVQQKIAKLYIIERYSVKEIAEDLSVSSSVVYYHLGKIRKRLMSGLC